MKKIILGMLLTIVSLGMISTLTHADPRTALSAVSIVSKALRRYHKLHEIIDPAHWHTPPATLTETVAQQSYMESIDRLYAQYGSLQHSYIVLNGPIAYSKTVTWGSLALLWDKVLNEIKPYPRQVRALFRLLYYKVPDKVPIRSSVTNDQDTFAVYVLNVNDNPLNFNCAIRDFVVRAMYREMMTDQSFFSGRTRDLISALFQLNQAKVLEIINDEAKVVPDPFIMQILGPR